MKMIRWKGLIAFVVITAALAAFFVLIADGLVEKGIESTGTRIVGAKVDLADADLTFFPLGLALTGLQITNPDAPMKNAVAIGQIRFGMNPWDLIEKKVIIDEMMVSGVQFNTDRSVSGAAKKKQKPEKKREKAAKEAGPGKTLELPPLSVADARTILEREELQCVREIERLEADIKQKEAEIRQMVKDLPNEETFNNYRTRLNRLDDGKGVMGILSGITEAKQIKEDIQADLARIRQAKEEIETTVNTLEKRLKEVARAPRKDVARLKEKYAISAQGLGNLTRLVFGPEYGRWMDKGLAWYEKLKPLMAKAASARSEKSPKEVPPSRGDGVNVRFNEHTPKPDFLVKLADVSVNTGRGQLTGRVLDIASDQTVTGRPTTWAFDTSTLEGIQSLAVNGALDRTTPATPQDTLNIDARHIRLTDVVISDSTDLPLMLESGQLDLALDTTITNGKLRSNGQFTLIDTAFAGANGQSMSRVQRAIVQAIAGIPEITINTTVRGTPEKPDINVSSNIDTVVQRSVDNIVQQETAALEKKLQQAISARTGGRIDKLGDNVNGLDQIAQRLTSRLNQGSRILAQ